MGTIRVPVRFGLSFHSDLAPQWRTNNTMSTKPTARRARVTPIAPSFGCAHCSLRFATQEALTKHRSAGYCYSESTMYSFGWAKRNGAWLTSIPEVKRFTRNRAGTTEEPVQCALCKKPFADLTAFRAHHVNRFTPIERCLGADELTALDFRRSKADVWGAQPFTQLLPSQAARLATVRQEIEALAIRAA